jgi:hypothetical protein
MLKKELFSKWHGFRPRNDTMMKRFTYKELTLVLGIAVALVVIFTLWLRHPSGSFSDSLRIPTPAGVSTVKKSSVKNYFAAFGELLSGRSNPY